MIWILRQDGKGLVNKWYFEADDKPIIAVNSLKKEVGARNSYKNDECRKQMYI